MYYFVKCLKKYFSFKGRASRAEYWTFFFIAGLIGLSANFLSPFMSILGLALILPLYAVTARRLHDLNMSSLLVNLYFFTILFIIVVAISAAILNYYHIDLSFFNSFRSIFFVLAGFVISILGLIIFIILPLIPGNKESNKYGPPEK